MRRKLRIHTIHNRLFLLFLLSMLGLLFVLSYLYYRHTSDQFQTKISDIAQKNVSQSVDNFDLLLRGYDSLTKSVSANLDMQRLLVQPNQDSAVRAINWRTITNMISTIFYSREDVLGIHVMTYDGSIYSYEDYVYTIDEKYRERDWYKRIRESTGEMVWLGVNEGSFIDPTLDRPVFAFGRQIYNLTNHVPIGEVLIEVDPKYIKSSLSNMLFGPHSEAYIVETGEGGAVVASTVPAAGLPAEVRDFRMPKADRQVIVDLREDELVVSAKPAMAEWTVVSMTPNGDLNVELQQTRQFLLIVLSASVLVAIALAQFVSRTVSRPLKRLIHQMKQVERGNFSAALNMKSYEEFNVLVASFNQMVNQIDELIERIKVTSISEKNAQLQALQSQINPHFLYNTLDMIYWMLDEQQNERLGRVVLALSQMFRYSSHWEKDSEVTLAEELQQVRHYMTIIESRLEGRLTVTLEVEERWHELRLPKMTLQPILENAVKYGLEALERPGALRVHARAEDDVLRIVVEDNGAGMAPDTLARLRFALDEAVRDAAGGKHDAAASLAASEAAAAVEPAAADTSGAATPARRGIGLENVQRRLVLMFGSRYGLHVASAPGQGTRVTVTIPLPRGGEASHEHPDR